MIYIKTPEEIKMIKKSSRLASRTLDHAEKLLKPGLTTLALDKAIHDFIVSNHAVPASLGYRGFPGSACISINEEVVHAIPGTKMIRTGDLVKIDVTTILNGFFGDTCRTFFMGKVSPIAEKLTKATYEAMMLAIGTVKNGSYLGDIGAAIQGHVEPQGFSVVRDFVGHGVGKEFHEDPNIPHFGKAGTGLQLKSGMIITIEPMINEGSWEIEILSDKWTAVTADGKLSAQFEHTLLVTDTGAEILTVSTK